MNAVSNAVSFTALFERQVERTPHATALVTGSLAWSYAALNERANRLAHALRQQGIGPGHVVALALPRSGKMIVNELAVLKAGAAFLPIDPNYPGDRINYMLRDADPSLLLTDSAALRALPTGVSDLVTVWALDSDELRADLAVQPHSNPCAPVALSDAAYLIYTSGTTGRPKGVVVTHEGVTNLAESLVRQLDVTPDARVAQIASPSFDASVMEMLMAFGCGATLVVPLRDVMAGDVLAEALADLAITHALIPPSTLATIPPSDHGFPMLKVLAVGGEACSPELVARWAPGRRMINAYGPTEATVCTTLSQPLNAGGLVPLGRPLPDMQVMVLNEKLRPMPVGVPGELYIAGVGLARGYLKRPGLTAERFVANPYGGPGSRMYRTGDFVRWRSDRSLEYMGRSDGQVKLRGFRIELGEIESTLAVHPDVISAVVVLREDRPGDKRLVAYLVSKEGSQLDIGELRAFAGARLADYMLPSHYVLLDRLPLTPNGKLDRAALPIPDRANAEGRRPWRAPATPTEHKLCRLFADVLDLTSLEDADANFFDIGGHSLLAVQLGSRIRDEIRADFPIAGVYHTPVLSALAALLDGKVSLSEELDLTRDSRLPFDLKPRAGASLPTAMRRVFLTGATGYVGTYLLAELLRKTTATVVCHVRANDDAAARERLLDALRQHGFESVWAPERVAVALGDLGRPLLGLSPQAADTVRDTCDTLLHCGAQVDFLHSYESLKAANVDALTTLLEWTVQGCAKRLHHVSTLGIVDTSKIRGTVSETTPLDSWRGLVGGYNQSKWVADQLAVKAQQVGLPVTVYRLGSVTGDRRNALCNPSDFIWRVLGLCAELGAVPDIDLPLNMTPVCEVARAVVALARDECSDGQVFHLLSGHELTLKDVCAVFEGLGLSTQTQSVPVWADLARRKLADSRDDKLLALMAILSKYKAAPERPHIVGEATREQLERLNAPIQRVSRSLLARYLCNLGIEGAPSVKGALSTRTVTS